DFDPRLAGQHSILHIRGGPRNRADSQLQNPAIRCTYFPDPFRTTMSDQTQSAAWTSSENKVWEGKPSNWKGFPCYFFCLILAAGIGAGAYFYQAKSGQQMPVLYAALALPLIMAFFKRLWLKSTNYRLTDQRLFVDEGVLSRKSEELE